MILPTRKSDDVGNTLAQFARKVKDNMNGYKPSIIGKTIAGPRPKLVSSRVDKSSSSPHSSHWRPHAGFRLRSSHKNPVHITDHIHPPPSTAKSLGDQIAAAQARHSASIVQERSSPPRKRKRVSEPFDHTNHEDQTIPVPVTGALNTSHKAAKAGIPLATYVTAFPTPTRPESVERLHKLKDVYHIIINRLSPIVPAVLQGIDVRVWRPTLAEFDDTLAQVAARYEDAVQDSADKQEKLCKWMDVAQKAIERADGEESPEKRRRLEKQAKARDESILRTVQREAIEKDIRIADLQAQLEDSKAECTRLRDEAKRKEAESLATGLSSGRAHHENTQPQSGYSAALDGSTTPTEVSLLPGWTAPSPTPSSTGGAQQATPVKMQPAPPAYNGLQTPAPSPPRSSTPWQGVSRTMNEPQPSVEQGPLTNTEPASTQPSPLQLSISFDLTGPGTAPPAPALSSNDFSPSTPVAQQQFSFGSSEPSSLPSSGLQPSYIQPDIPALSVTPTNSFPVAQDTIMMDQEPPLNEAPLNPQQTHFQFVSNFQTGVESPGSVTATQSLDTVYNQSTFQTQPGGDLYALGHRQTEHVITQPFEIPISQPTAVKQSSIFTPTAQTNAFASRNAVTPASTVSLACYGPVQTSTFAPVAQSNPFAPKPATERSLAQFCTAFGLSQPTAQAQVQSDPSPTPQSLSSPSVWGQPASVSAFSATARPFVFGGAPSASTPEAASGSDHDISMGYNQPKMSSHPTPSRMEGKFAPASAENPMQAKFKFKSSGGRLALTSQIPLNEDDFVRHPCMQEVIQAVLASNSGVRGDSLEMLLKREYEKRGVVGILNGVQALLKKNDYMFPEDCRKIFKKHDWL